MHARFARGASRSAALAAALTAALTCATAATAQASEPTPSASAAPAETSAADAGSVAITTKDTAGDVLPGASFLLLDSTGQETGRGRTDAQGKLTFPDLAPGVYRLKETDSGSPLHDVAADQDVIVAPGATAPVTVIDPFKPAHLILKAKDNKNGKLLPGSTVNIGTGGTTLLTLTTGPKGTASGDLPISSRTTQFWVKQTKAPSGYALYKPTKTFTAGPGAPVTVTVTNSKTATGSSPAPTEKATDQPSNTATTQGDKAVGGTSARPADSAMTDTDSSPASDASDETTSTTPSGSLAHTGADASPWLVGGAGLLVASGIGILVTARARRTDANTPSGED
ncbi:SpaA isopeptide-forming pilin-related protein [Streptomyces sp. NPDC001663]|uniref:SpaA isopeptide-forming pilin-related protein n=1 Tax=Streptomyces sp. NPDC001663 TaxID=3364597 RepID=UPI0036B38F7F